MTRVSACVCAGVCLVYLARKHLIISYEIIAIITGPYTQKGIHEQIGHNTNDITIYCRYKFNVQIIRIYVARTHYDLLQSHNQHTVKVTLISFYLFSLASLILQIISINIIPSINLNDLQPFSCHI